MRNTLATIGAAVVALGAACGAMRQPPACSRPTFDGDREVEEAGSMAESPDPCWWLSSGAQLSLADGVARTVQGALPDDAPWRQRYAASNEADTDAGRHPQNLLRLVTRVRIADARQQLRFRILRVNQSSSPERGEWSGVFLFLRYQDQDNLYYGGLRMDGTAVIKKKTHGTYATLTQRPVYGRPESYDRRANPSLLPIGQWISLAADVGTEADGSVHIRLYAHDDGEPWRLVAEARDAPSTGEPIREAGNGGLRSDFVDAEFAEYSMVPM
jgi:hypothetical protein